VIYLLKRISQFSLKSGTCEKNDSDYTQQLHMISQNIVIVTVLSNQTV